MAYVYVGYGRPTSSDCCMFLMPMFMQAIHSLSHHLKSMDSLRTSIKQRPGRWHAEVDNDITKVKLRRSEITDDIKDKEQVIDNALLFMSNPASFWNLAPIEVKRRIQDYNIPRGLSV